MIALCNRTDFDIIQDMYNGNKSPADYTIPIVTIHDPD
jgi:hypothetical protein